MIPKFTLINHGSIYKIKINYFYKYSIRMVWPNALDFD